jgi:hypothetical protein
MTPPRGLFNQTEIFPHVCSQGSTPLEKGGTDLRREPQQEESERENNQWIAG